MFDQKSDYALNKKDPAAIVFKTATGAYIRLHREEFCRLLLEGINTCLSETQRRRLLKFYFEGQTEVEIAAAEKVSQSKIAESIWRAKENLKKFFKKAV